MLNTKFKINIFLIFLIFIIGCASSRILLSAKKVNFPVSLTEYIYDEQYNLLAKGNYFIIHKMKLKYSNYTVSPFSKPKSINLSDTLLSILRKYEGDAIVNLIIKGRASTSHNAMGQLVTILSLGIVSPSHIETIIEFDVVKVKR